jgi:hypothetical protein
MKGLDKIVERVMKVSEEPKFIREKFVFWEEEELSKCTHARVIYAELPNNRLFIDGYVMEQKDFEHFEKGIRLGPKEDFRNFLQSGHPKTFNDVLVLLTIYFSLEDHSTVDNNRYALPLKPFPLKDPIVDSILYESKGYLMWKYQLEKFIGLFESDIDVINRLTPMIRLRKHLGFEWLKTKFIRKGISLKNVFEERMILDRVYQPKMHSAFRLYNVLFPSE